MNNAQSVLKFLPAGDGEILERVMGTAVNSIHGLISGLTFEVVPFFSQTSYGSDTFQKMKMLHNALKMLLEPLNS